MSVWVNGKLLERADEPVLAALDHGFVVGDGVFEVMAIIDGVPFALTRHLKRLERSAAGLGIGAVDLGAVRTGIEAVLGEWAAGFGRVRVTVSSGPGALGSPRGPGPQTVMVAAEPAPFPAPATSAVIVEWRRNEYGALAGLKTTSYAENAKMVEYARACGASEALMANTRGQLCEGTGSNVFYVLDGRICTPTLASGCLAGVTRALAIEWLRAEFEVQEVDAPIEVLDDADEVFLTGTTRHIQGVATIGERDYPAPGPITARSQEIWADAVRRGLDP